MQSKRRRTNKGREEPIGSQGISSKGREEHIDSQGISFAPLLNQIRDDGGAFEQLMGNLLLDYAPVVSIYRAKQAEKDLFGQYLRPPTRAEVSSLAQSTPSSIADAIAIRKLKLHRERRIASLPSPLTSISSSAITPLPAPSAQGVPAPPEVLAALNSIQHTPYENSFLSRIRGCVPQINDPAYALVAIDWETTTPWMSLMQDVREHFGLRWCVNCLLCAFCLQ